CLVFAAPVKATKPQLSSISRKERASNNDSQKTIDSASFGISTKKSLVSLEGFKINCISFGSVLGFILDRNNTLSIVLSSPYNGIIIFRSHIQLLFEYSFPTKLLVFLKIYCNTSLFCESMTCCLICSFDNPR